MEVARTRPGSRRGPAEWFTGEVWLDELAGADHPTSRAQLLSVHFAPGARTAWHTHPHGQVLHVTEGAGLAQSRGGPVEPISAGDTISVDPGEEHWHGAAPETFMTHLALQEADDAGVPTHWGEHVSDDEYRASPS